MAYRLWGQLHGLLLEAASRKDSSKIVLNCTCLRPFWLPIWLLFVLDGRGLMRMILMVVNPVSWQVGRSVVWRTYWLDLLCLSRG